MLTSVSCPCYDIVVVGRLFADHLGYKLGVMAEVGVHNDNEVARGELD
jgi:hypothetical protein